MILEALYRYYQILQKDPDVDIALPGYSAANVSFALNLSRNGDLLDILPLFEKVQRGKRVVEVPRRMIVPEQVKRAGKNPSPNFLCDNSAFVLGISTNDDNDPEFSKNRFEAFKQHNLSILSQAGSPESKAVISFLKNHDPNTARSHPAISRNIEGLLKGGNLIFFVSQRSILDIPDVCRVWEEYRLGSSSLEMQCLVSGITEAVARLHPNIQGVRFAQSSGASLVSFNERAYESYNRTKEQGINSPVSQRVASGYGVALNYLLSDQNPNRKIILGDTTIVYWAESENKAYANAFAALLDPAVVEEQPDTDQKNRKAADEKLGKTIEKVTRIQPLDLHMLTKDLDFETRFYVLGLAPNAARLAVRFFLTDSFGKFVERIMLHYEDLKIIKEFPDQSDYLSISKILRECVSPKVTRREEEIQKTWSLLGGAVTRAVLSGAPYPEALYTAMINRIRVDADQNGNKKINYTRAAVIKAHLIRKYRRQGQNPYQEVLQMSLNPQYSHPAYVLGRLFAVLEKAQREAIGEVNASIKDRYFASACATPASVFPVLLRLSQHYFSKAEYGKANDNRIQDLLNLLDVEKNPFPARLTLDEQGIFVLGYYHQRADFFNKKQMSEEALSNQNN
ncbi:CRISPR-associated protein Csd1 [Ornatilinea apprima]|uniref:CRISPR-associated protein Csd1 n=1 Tax=Ornatilinea apprima TaxID=1134406 RepID=A0A0P6X9S3_9CHLR|nr:type I-C CRISPR-associated protein Cas8c/Csd1 [Ornatilinea apprima]KPL78807.1 CRISPR-associated protein Csd1 [Ornatilinea apprima]